MTSQPINNVGRLRTDFTGEAANDEEPPLYRQLLEDMDSQREDIGRSFRDEMTGVFREMNLDAALTKQSGMLNGVPLGTDIPVIEYTDLAVWMYVEIELWDAIMDSYMEDLALSDPEKFTTLYHTAGPACEEPLDIKAMRLAFEDSYKDEMKTLSLVADTLRRNMPGVTTETRIEHVGDTHITPIVRVRPPAGQDLRDIVRAYVNRQTMNSLRPIPD